jgi:type II secretory pathway pseudopilin PulG
LLAPALQKCARARKSAKRDWDATNNTSQQQQQQQQHTDDTDSGSGSSPGPASPHAAAAPARAGSADANNSSASGLSSLAATADAAVATLQQQQQQPVVKRVRFALADDEAMESEDDHLQLRGGEQARHVVVRRIGPRAQARKRMHKPSARRRRPQRAPLF